MAVMMPAWAQTQEPWQAPATGLTVTAGDNAGELNISWNAHPDEPTHYRVKWAAYDGDFAVVTDNDWNAFPTASSNTVTGLTPGGQYKAMVRAKYDGKRSAWRDVATGYAAEPTPEPTVAPTPAPTPEPTPEPTAAPETVPRPTIEEVTPEPTSEPDPLVAQQQQEAQEAGPLHTQLESVRLRGPRNFTTVYVVEEDTTERDLKVGSWRRNIGKHVDWVTVATFPNSPNRVNVEITPGDAHSYREGHQILLPITHTPADEDDEKINTLTITLTDSHNSGVSTTYNFSVVRRLPIMPEYPEMTARTVPESRNTQNAGDRVEPVPSQGPGRPLAIESISDWTLYT